MPQTRQRGDVQAIDPSPATRRASFLGLSCGREWLVLQGILHRRFAGATIQSFQSAILFHQGCAALRATLIESGQLLAFLMFTDLSTGRSYPTRAESDPPNLRANAPSSEVESMIEAALAAVDDPAAKLRISKTIQAALDDVA